MREGDRRGFYIYIFIQQKFLTDKLKSNVNSLSFNRDKANGNGEILVVKFI